ncbi:DUF6668 family protein [Microbacterium sp. NPDC055665]
MMFGTRTAPRPAPGRTCYGCTRALSPVERAFCGGCGRPIPVLVPAHHGAGVTTIAEATGFRDTDEAPRAATHPQAVRLLVARTHHAGLEAARLALAETRTTGTYTRLLLVPDAPGRLPKPLSDQVTIIAGPTPTTPVPWVEAWRWAPGTSTETSVKFFTTLAGQLTTDRP